MEIEKIATFHSPFGSKFGGNVRVGVFASRSPFRPNGLGLSSVRLDHVEWDTPRGPVLHVLGADLMNGTPVYDIKPYVTYADSHPEARSGFVDRRQWQKVEVEMPADVLAQLRAAGLTAEDISALRAVLEEDPRPQIQRDEDKVYGMPFAGLDIKFQAVEGKLVVRSSLTKGLASSLTPLVPSPKERGSEMLQGVNRD